MWSNKWKILPDEWGDKFDVLSKEPVDAIYLSGDGKFYNSTKECLHWHRDICISVAGVI